MERRHTYGGGVMLAGLVLTVIQIVQGIQQVEGFDGRNSGIVFSVGTVPFVLVGFALIYVGYWLSLQDEYDQDFPRIAAWGVGSTLLFASVSALIVFSQQVKPTVDILEQAPVIAMNHITIGAVVGILVGLYDARGRSHQRALETERDRVELFAKKAMDINTYGRELNRSDSIDAVSALCIQAIQGFLGLSETAFTIVSDDEYELIDNTVVNAPEEELAELARQSRAQEQTTVATHDSLPEGLQSRADGAISLLITDLDGSSVVLLALTDDTDAFDEEDIQLLELLLTHAATSLDHIHHTPETDA
jgi:hypothetical protein